MNAGFLWVLIFFSNIDVSINKNVLSVLLNNKIIKMVQDFRQLYYIFMYAHT